MSERLETILGAAYACFTRHGVRRTTMDDIAREAGMSRAAIYQYVRNKDDAFRRLAVSLFDQALAEGRAAAQQPGGTPERLYAVLATKLELTLRLWRDSPHAPELLDAGARQGGDLVDAYTDEMTALVEQVVAADAGPRARTVAEIAVAMTRGLEADHDRPEATRRRLRVGSDLIAAGLTVDRDA